MTTNILLTSTDSRIVADPRSKFVLLLAVNAIAMGNSNGWLIAATSVLVGCLLVADLRPGTALSYAALVAASAVIAELPHHFVNGLVVGLGVIFHWILRFTVSLAMGGWFILSTRVGDLVAAMTAARLPRTLIIPLAVLFRFLPMAIDEARGVIEAMALRGYRGSYLWRHPITAMEKLVVPVLTASARTADELSAAALIRGLGSTRRPTIVADLHFRWIDAVFLTLALGLAGAAMTQAVMR
ncbi:hypothetical protein HMPREF1531_01112 [Propionibacterium sp. oral taxon 192 str. F0372]|nr:hypothetical protein HMPREF1531_01112 [Propionibacterium sp. oral taxon 192 str. F0372]